ncbi:MAG: phosphodiester glycosidase family protein [Oligoflexia bacterium]|nr:phosphodiester glycosidase family protein [Oligoflexia bacterium]
MTGDRDADASTLGVLGAVSLLVMALLWPAVPAAEPSAEPAAGPAPVLAELEVDPPRVLWEDHGLVLEQQAWRLGQDSGQAWRVHVARPGVAQVRAASGVTPFAELVPTDPGPWAAINGGFYEFGPMGLVVSDGEVRKPLSVRGGSGVFAWSKELGPSIVHRSAYVPGATQAVQSIDRLVDQGRRLVKRREGARAAARSAVAISKDGLWLVALADDDSIVPLVSDTGGPKVEGAQLRATVARGLPLWAFADYLRTAVGAQTALNLDGAISTQLTVVGAEHRFEIRGERGTINAVVIRPAVATPAAP